MKNRSEKFVYSVTIYMFKYYINLDLFNIKVILIFSDQLL